MDEDEKNWNEMVKTMMKINIKSYEIFNTIHIKDQVRNFKTILK